jgi:hypothetical protein
MNIQAIKLELVEQILKSKSPEILAQLLSVVKSEKEDFWKLLSKEEKKEIMEGIDQLDKGERHSYESVVKKYRK